MAKPKKKPVAAKKGRRLHVRADLAHGGTLSVRHMSERTVFVEGELVAMADAEAKPVWIQLAKPGLFKGHPSGPFELNEKVFAEIVRNFKATENRAVAVDFEHASESSPTDGSIPVEGAPAQGWIKDIKIEAGNLWGLVEWGTKAREYIRSGQYRFFSPAIRFGARDRVTGQQIGARLTSGALTNSPFLDGLKPLAAKDATETAVIVDGTVSMRLAHSPAEYMPRIRCILGLSELSTAAECADQLERLQEHFEAAGEDPDGSHEGVPLNRFMYPLRGLVGATLSATWDDVFACVQSLIEAAIGDGDVEDDDDDLVSATDKTNEPTNDAGDGVTITAADPAATENAMSVEKIAELSTKNAELTVSLKDHETKLTDVSVKLTAAESKAAELGLALKDETAKREAAESELKSLRDWKASEETKAFDARITDAFDSYKDVKKLTDDDREAMKIVLKANPERFEKLYPRVEADKRHLQRNLTEERPTGAAKLVGDDGGVTKSIDLASAARTLSAQKGISLGEAQRFILRSTTARPLGR